MARFCLLVAISLSTPLLFAFDEMNASTEEVEQAITEVQKQMQSLEFSQQAAKESKEAADVANYVKALSGDPALEKEIYKLAAEILGNMKGKDLTQIHFVLEEAKKNPEGFAKKWTPEQRRKLQELSRKLPAANQTSP